MIKIIKFSFLDFQATVWIFFHYTNKQKGQMADTSDFRNGLIIKYKNDLYTIVEFQHVKPGKGGAFVRTTLKGLRTGKVLDNTFRSG